MNIETKKITKIIEAGHTNLFDWSLAIVEIDNIITKVKEISENLIKDKIMGLLIGNPYGLVEYINSLQSNVKITSLEISTPDSNMHHDHAILRSLAISKLEVFCPLRGEWHKLSGELFKNGLPFTEEDGIITMKPDNGNVCVWNNGSWSKTKLC